MAAPGTGESRIIIIFIATTLNPINYFGGSD